MSEIGSGIAEIIKAPIKEIRAPIDSLRPLIKQGIEHPLNIQDLISGKSGKESQRIGLFNGFSKEEAAGIFNILSEEAKLAQVENKAFIHPERLIEHEMQHITAAENLGVNLKDCKLQMFFINNDKVPQNVDLDIHFFIPEKTDPWVKMETSLAPDRMSDGDILAFIEAAKSNKGLLITNPVKTADLFKRYKEKNGTFPRIW